MSKAYSISWNLTNPIPDLITDKADLIKFFGTARFLVPYAVQRGKTAHATLRLLFDLYDLSPVQKAVVAAKLDFCFGNGFKTTNGGDTDNTGEFIDFLTSIGIRAPQITDIARASCKDEAVCGTTFVLARITEVNGQWQASLTQVEPTHCLPGYDLDNKNSDFNNTVLYNDKPIESLQSLYDSASKYQKWKMVGKWPRVTKSGKVFETMFQMNSVGHEGKFWGRPTADTNNLYIDYQSTNSGAKISSSEVIAKVLALMKEPDPELLQQAGKTAEQVKTEIAGGLRGTLTNKGAESQSLGILFYSDEKPEIVQVGINRDYQYKESTRKEVVQNICAAHGIPANLCGLEEMRVGLGGTVILDTLIKTNGMKIMPTQKRFADFFSDMMTFFAGYTGFDMGSHKLEFIGPIPEMIEQLTAVRSKTTTTNADTTQQTGGGNSE